MTTQYRGIKVNPKNTYDKKVNSFKGIYRGIKTDTKNEKSTQPREGNYRGSKWVA